MPPITPNQKIQHVFVLMLENHSFDHLLGYSAITGQDVATGLLTKINGLTGNESNTYRGVPYPVKSGAGNSMPVDPGHEFEDTITQLAGPGVLYQAGRKYPPINNSGFVDNYVNSQSTGEGKAPNNYGEIMKCFAPEQLPVLTTLAREFAVCDNWFSSMPGPTWPNRFFLHAASSGYLDHSPTTAEIAEWETFSGIRFEHGTIFDRLSENGIPWRIYRGDKFPADAFPNVSALKGIQARYAHSYANFEADVTNPGYPAQYTFIEPSYGNILNNTYKGGNSQHPLDDIRNGEQLIKHTYEAIRKSPFWNSSALIITWDEHGGFYDHVAPPPAPSPGDVNKNRPSINQHGFDFTQYGVRVPAVVVSPLIPKNVIDHRLYDHTSVPATLGKLFGFPPLTQRDAKANNLLSLFSLATPRTDTLEKLTAQAPPPAPPAHAIAAHEAATANKGSLPGFLHAALNADLLLSPDAQKKTIIKNFKKIVSQADAEKYMLSVQQKIDSAQQTTP